MRNLKNECSVQCGAAAPAAALKIQKPKRTQKGMQNQSMMLCGPPTWCHTHTHTLVQLQLQLHKLEGSWPQCGHNRSSAWRLNPPSPAGPSGQAQSIKRVKRRNAPGRMGAEGQRSCTGAQNKRSQLAVQALSVSLSHCSSLFLRFLCKCSGCVSARLRLSRVSVLKCPFLLANEAGQNGCWPQHSRCVNVCVCVCQSVC